MGKKHASMYPIDHILDTLRMVNNVDFILITNRENGIDDIISIDNWIKSLKLTSQPWKANTFRMIFNNWSTLNLGKDQYEFTQKVLQRLFEELAGATP